MTTRTLVLDDERMIRDLMTRGLTRVGHEVEAVSNSEEALSMMTKKDFDIALVDWNLDNGQTAFGTIEVMRKLQPDCTIIVMSGLLPDGLEEITISKPCGFKTLLSTINDALERR